MDVKPNTKYHGAEAKCEISRGRGRYRCIPTKSRTKVEEHQFSATLVNLRSGFPGSNSYIQAGWMVLIFSYHNTIFRNCTLCF